MNRGYNAITCQISLGFPKLDRFSKRSQANVLYAANQQNSRAVYLIGCMEDIGERFEKVYGDVL